MPARFFVGWRSFARSTFLQPRSEPQPTDWTLDLFLPRDITEVRIFKPDEVLAEHFEAGEMVFEQGDFGDKIYFIRTGEVEAIRDGQIVAQLTTGDTFGEIALISNQARAAGIRARTTLDVVSVSREAFQQLLANVPGVKMTMQAIMDKHLKTSPPEPQIPG